MARAFRRRFPVETRWADEVLEVTFEVGVLSMLACYTIWRPFARARLTSGVCAQSFMDDFW